MEEGRRTIRPTQAALEAHEMGAREIDFLFTRAEERPTPQPQTSTPYRGNLPMQQHGDSHYMGFTQTSPGDEAEEPPEFGAHSTQQGDETYIIYQSEQTRDHVSEYGDPQSSDVNLFIQNTHPSTNIQGQRLDSANPFTQEQIFSPNRITEQQHFGAHTTQRQILSTTNPFLEDYQPEQRHFEVHNTQRQSFSNTNPFMDDYQPDLLTEQHSGAHMHAQDHHTNPFIQDYQPPSEYDYQSGNNMQQNQPNLKPGFNVYPPGKNSQNSNFHPLLSKQAFQPSVYPPSQALYAHPPITSPDIPALFHAAHQQSGARQCTYSSPQAFQPGVNTQSPRPTQEVQPGTNDPGHPQPVHPSRMQTSYPDDAHQHWTYPNMLPEPQYSMPTRQPGAYDTNTEAPSSVCTERIDVQWPAYQIPAHEPQSGVEEQKSWAYTTTGKRFVQPNNPHTTQYGAQPHKAHTAQYGAQPQNAHFAQHDAKPHNVRTAQQGAQPQNAHTAPYDAQSHNVYTAQYYAHPQNAHIAPHDTQTHDVHTAQYGAQPQNTHTAQHGAQPHNVRTSRYRAQPHNVHAPQHGAQPQNAHTAQYDAPHNAHTAQYGAQQHNVRTAQYVAQPQNACSAKYDAQPHSARTSQYGAQQQNVRTNQYGEQPQSAHTAQYGAQPQNAHTAQCDAQPHNVHTAQYGAQPHYAHTAQHGAQHNVHTTQYGARTDPNALTHQDYSLHTELMKKELLSQNKLQFNDAPDEFRLWKSRVLERASKVSFTPAQMLEFMCQSTDDKSEAQSLLERLSRVYIRNPALGLQEAWNKLEDRFGSTDRVVDALIDKMNKLPTPSDARSLQKFSDIIEEVRAAQLDESLEGLNVLDSPVVMKPIIAKLPDDLARKWRDTAFQFKENHNLTFPPLEHFANFIARQARIRNDSALMVKNETQPRWRRWPQGSNVRTYDTEVQNDECPIHHVKSHTLLECKAFLKLNFEDRVKSLQECNLCIRCADAHDEPCTKPLHCIYCKKKTGHCSALHINGWSRRTKPETNKERTTASAEGGEHQAESVETKCTQLCGPGQTGLSCSKILLADIYLDKSPNKRTRCYVAIDEQSNRSLVKSDVFDQFGIHTPKYPYNLRTCSGVSRESGRRLHGLIIESVDHNTIYKLPTCIERNEIPSNKEEIPTPEIAKSHEHLKVIADKLPELDHDAEVLLLIGKDAPELHKIRDSINGPTNSPWAQKLDLGWVIVGSVCLDGHHLPQPQETVQSYRTEAIVNGRPTIMKPCRNKITCKEILTANAEKTYADPSVDATTDATEPEKITRETQTVNRKAEGVTEKPSEADETASTDSLTQTISAVTNEKSAAAATDSDNLENEHSAAELTCKENANTAPNVKLSDDNIFAHSKEDENIALSIEDTKFLETMAREEDRTEAGNWMYPLPLRNQNKPMPNNRPAAYKRMLTLAILLAKNPVIAEKYFAFMKKIIDLDLCEICTTRPVPGFVQYLSHFGHFHPRKGDLRVVFDAAMLFQGMSLNKALLTGPTEALVNSLFGIMVRFRNEPVGVIADIELMFYSFYVAVKHRDYLRFFWYANNNANAPIVEYRMKVQVFGNCSSPAIATYALRRTAELGEEEFGSDCREFVHRNFYVDDGITSCPTAEAAVDLVSRTQAMLATCNLRLHKIASNNIKVMEHFPAADRAKDVQDLDLSSDPIPVQRSLGLCWDLTTDRFVFKTPKTDAPFSPRGGLSIVNGIYDPIGFTAPVTIGGKVLLREMTMDMKTNKSKADWDAPFPTFHQNRWDTWTQSLRNLTQLAIPRSYSTQPMSESVRRELHGFCDASNKAIAACVFIRLINKEDRVEVSFVTGKAKLAPVDEARTPRLELCAAVLLTEIMDAVTSSIDIEIQDIKYYTDSRVVLGYISNEVRRFHQYVANRVKRIRLSTSPDQWQHVHTLENPADIGSRSIDCAKLANSAWLNGPTFLLEAELPSSDRQSTLAETDPEIKVAATKATSSPQLGTDRFSRLHSWKSVVTSIVYIKRAMRKFLNTKHPPISQVTGAPNASVNNTKENLRKHDNELFNESEIEIISRVQQEAFQTEWTCLKTNKPLPKTSALLKLHPTFDGKLLRVGGRLHYSNLHSLAKHPVILPKGQRITTLIIRHYHTKIFHQGRKITAGAIREAGFWIIGGKRMISSELFHCVTCRILRGPFIRQIMAQLPTARTDTDTLTNSAPFEHVGVDVFGHWTIAARRTRGGCANSKRWAVCFSDFTTRGIHLEVLEEMTSSSFINAMRRMQALRGPVISFYSDRGSNFVGTIHELLQSKEVLEYLRDEQIEWKLNPAHASHFGGVWERMNGICRRILDAILLQTHITLTHEVLTTFMAEVVAIVNNRPLVPISTDPEVPEILTPNRILTLKRLPLYALSGDDPNDVYGRQWKQVQRLASEFWKKWRSEYLPLLQTTQKWNVTERDVEVGDLVLMKTDSHRNEWPKARIVTVSPSIDGKVRKVEIQTCRNGHKKVYTRPISELVLLLSVDEQNSTALRRGEHQTQDNNT